MNLKYMSAEQLIRTIKSQAAEDALNGHEEFRCTAFGGELLSRIERGERAVKAMEQFYEKHKQWFVDYPKVVQKDKFSDDLVKMFDQWRAGKC